MDQEPQEEVQEPLFRRVIEFGYERLIVPYVILVFVLHILDLPPWKVYLLAPLTLQISFILIAKLLLIVYEHGIFATLWRWTKRIGEILFGYGETVVGWVNTNKFSRIIWFLASLNLTLIFWYVYKNVDIFKLITDLYALFMDMVVYFSNPAKIMESLNQLLQRARLLQLLKWFKIYYFDPTLEAIDKGDPTVLFSIALMSLFLLLCGAIPTIVIRYFR